MFVVGWAVAWWKSLGGSFTLGATWAGSGIGDIWVAVLLLREAGGV